jgi:peptidoglycan/xylan/chitin deacetylase (PgdA/CDA1 family)
MYHYVRPLARSRYPAIKGLDVDLFREQVLYLRRHYNSVSLANMVAAVRENAELPCNPVLLTFDDGYRDHYTYALPILIEQKMDAVFFPPTSVVLEHRVLDVNKIHFILAAAPNVQILIEELEQEIANHRQSFELMPIAAYREKYWISSRLDPGEIIYLKLMLQHALPLPLRSVIIDQLFRRFVSQDEAAFAEELYLSVDQLRHMASIGMQIGVHGVNHLWLDRLSREQQATEIDGSLELLDLIGVARTDFAFCYPYGGYNSDTLEILRDRGCAAAMTAKAELANLEKDSMLELPRLDTNDLPKDRFAEMVHPKFN